MKRALEKDDDDSEGGSSRFASISYPSASTVAASNSFLTLKNDAHAPILLANEVRNAKVDTEADALVEQRTKYIQ